MTGEEVDAVGAADGTAGVLVHDKAAESLPAANAFFSVEDRFFALDESQGSKREKTRVGGNAAPGGQAGAERAGRTLLVDLKKNVTGI